MKTRGFVLIEIVTYVGLFSLLLGGLFLCAWQLYSNNATTSAQVTAQDEVNFVLKKLDWVFTGAMTSSIHIKPNGEITLNKFGFSDNPITLRLINGRIEIELNGVKSYLTTINVNVESLIFNYNSTTNILSATFKINNTTGTITRLLKI